ncbi:MAG: DNA/RNA non-specific endonuclease [Chakrabartia sp.]
MQNRNFNRGAYRALEDKWAKMLRQGDHIRVSITPRYSGGSARPDRIVVTYIQGNEQKVINFINSDQDTKNGE